MVIHFAGPAEIETEPNLGFFLLRNGLRPPVICRPCAALGHEIKPNTGKEWRKLFPEAATYGRHSQQFDLRAVRDGIDPTNQVKSSLCKEKEI